MNLINDGNSDFINVDIGTFQSVSVFQSNIDPSVFVSQSIHGNSFQFVASQTNDIEIHAMTKESFQNMSIGYNNNNGHETFQKLTKDPFLIGSSFHSGERNNSIYDLLVKFLQRQKNLFNI